MTNTTRTLTFSFDGSEHEDHHINLATYIESLEGLVDLVTQANKIVNGESSEVEMEVVAEQPGSFETVVNFVQSGGVDVLSQIGLMGGAAAAGSLFGVLDWLKGRPMQEINIKTDGTGEAKQKIATINVEGDTLDCSEITAKLLKNPKIRLGIDKLVHTPLSSDGTSKVTVKNGDDITLQIENENANIYKKPESLMVVETVTDDVEGNVNFTKINFNGAAGWEMQYGPLGRFAIRMEDIDFLAKINESDENGKFVDISSTDLFSVDMTRTEEEVNGRKRKAKYVVTKVKRHRKHVGKIV
ncbi:hypothetical protein BCU94_06875 [Shewanella sp. 10N.286.52.C2]|uniref:hypothetical protein n=1 Tax=Shewanella sp. 10N.286.52.C2 TaxID=1880838 RepID=UPI000C842161|nr:hypothetical protein [Shewanella sp. 10N.286.52.C2]PMG31891.1 hypothetical protein BCU94_06875 [Shewanella sp. 10N.286.52.C2]